MTKNENSLVELGGNSQQLDREVDREKLNINSPRGKGTKNMFTAPESLITQVNQDNVVAQKEIAKKIMAARVDDQKENEQEIISHEQSPIAANSVSKFSCWLCCGSCTKKDEHEQIKPDSYRSEHENNVVATDNSSDLVVETKIMDEDEEVNDEVDLKEEQNENEIAETRMDWLLGPVHPSNHGRKCLVLDLDETLVHSSFQEVDCSFFFPIVLHGMEYEVFVQKRPFVDEFIAECAKLYELVIFTASLSEYANPVIDTIDPHGYIKYRLFRESCVLHEQMYVKDLSRLGRNIKDCIIIDNSPLSYLFDPNNAIECTSWFGDPTDTELMDLLPVLNGQLLAINDVRTMLDATNQTVEWLIDQYGDKNKKREIVISE